MYFEPNVYSFDNLKPEDKRQLEVLEYIKARLLSRAAVDIFVNDKDIAGSTIQGVYRDILNEFIKYLGDQLEYAKVDMIMEKIDSYPEEELREIMTARIPQSQSV